MDKVKQCILNERKVNPKPSSNVIGISLPNVAKNQIFQTISTEYNKSSPKDNTIESDLINKDKNLINLKIVSSGINDVVLII